MQFHQLEDSYIAKLFQYISFKHILGSVCPQFTPVIGISKSCNIGALPGVWGKMNLHVVKGSGVSLITKCQWLAERIATTCNQILSRISSTLCSSLGDYCKFPKYLDTQKICCNHSKIWTMWLYHRVMSPNDAGRMANSVDLDQSSLIWVCTVCPGVSVRKLRIVTVLCALHILQ